MQGREVKSKDQEWHKWFAWHPAKIKLEFPGRKKPDGTQGEPFTVTIKVWLETVERRKVYASPDDVGTWAYRFLEGK